MKMRRDRMGRIKCWITGGHIFKPLEKAVRYVRSNDEFVVWRECKKCGKVYYDTIPAEWIRRAMERTGENAKTIKFSTSIDPEDLKDEYDIHIWNGQKIEFRKYIKPEFIDPIQRRPDAQLRPLRDMDEIKHYTGEETKGE